MEELRIVTSVQAGVIEFDDAKYKEDVRRQLKEFKGMTFDEKVGKSIIASLRAKVKEANAEAIRIGKLYAQPETDFRLKIKSVTALLEETIDDILIQTQAFETARVEKKKKDIIEAYKKAIDGFQSILPLDKIYDSRWENKGFILSDIEEFISDKVDSVSAEIETIKNMHSDAEQKALDGYMKDLNLSNAIQLITNYDQQQKEIKEKLEKELKEKEEQRVRLEIEKAKREERQKVQDEITAKAENDAKIKAAEEKARVEVWAEVTAEVVEEIKAVEQERIAPMQAKEIIADEPIIEALFSISATATEIEQIEMYLDSIGIEYAKEA